MRSEYVKGEGRAQRRISNLVTEVHAPGQAMKVKLDTGPK
jgi:hypothetical protein